jgi:hypothetical protein
LHRATTQSRDATAAAARQLSADIRGLLPRVASATWDGAALMPILDSLVNDAERGEFRDYAAAEQAAMAANSVLAAFEAAGAVDAAKAESLRGRIDALYDRVKDENGYNMAAFVAALRELRRAAG